ncbi:MAG: sigma-70 family RNA polymerase sigma factor [Bacteroidetes bacterium]|nr:sigma-70 family RNA polymerase sigma factor [Bacteroidota bacterium]
MDQSALIPHLFRTEFGRITSVLARRFGMAYIEVAEDIAGETFLAAMETWPYRGIPDNPTAWLYTVAANKAKNYLARDSNFQRKISPDLQRSETAATEHEIDLSAGNIKDSQLRMLFAICHPAIPQEAQIGMALRVLCGLGIDEIAHALLSNKETINKRLHRAKERLRSVGMSLDLPPVAEIGERLDTVLTTLYLLFNEGYYSETSDDMIREELCREAIRLTALLTENEQTDLPAVSALLALMCFHASRFAARLDHDGDVVLYADQDERLWDQELIASGVKYMNEAARGEHLTCYHIEAGIAYWHTIKEDTPEKWENILQLYNILLQIQYSPVAALNRTYALAKARSKEEAIAEAEKLQLTTNPYYYTLLGELYLGIDKVKAKVYLEKALTLAVTRSDRKVITQKLDALN